MFRPSAFARVKNCGRLVMRPYSMTACGRGATISATLLRTTSPQLLQEPRGLSAPLTSAIASGLIKSLSTQGTLVLSEKQNPEMEQLLEVSLDELVEDEESKSGVRLAKTSSCNTSDACGSSHTNSEMLERRIKEIAEKHVNFLSSSSETEQWKDLHLADPALKFKIVSEASSTLKKPLSNAQLTNILTLKDLIQTLCTPLPKASDAYPITWDLWKGTDHVAEFVKMKKRVSEDALPENVTFKPRKMVKKKSAVAQAV